VQIEDFDEGNVRLGTITTEFLTYATNIRHISFVMFKQLDLAQIKNLKYRVQTSGIGGNIEVRLGQPDGKLVSTVAIPAGKTKEWQEITAPLSGPEKGLHTLYFIFTNPEGQQQNLFNLDWIYFDNR
jgi:cytochrome c